MEGKRDGMRNEARGRGRHVEAGGEGASDRKSTKWLYRTKQRLLILLGRNNRLNGTNVVQMNG